MRVVLSERRFAGLTMQSVTYRWDAGEELIECDACVTLKYAAEQRSVAARAFEKEGAGGYIGRMVVTPPDLAIPVRSIEKEENFPVTILHLNNDWLNSVLKHEAGITIDNIGVDLDLRDSFIEGTLSRLSRELYKSDFSANDMIRALINVLAIDIARYVRRKRAGEKVSEAVLSPSQLSEIRQFVTSFTTGSPTPKDVIDYCAMSPAYLRRLFKNTTGKTLRNYIEEVRTERARALLIDTDLPLKEISYRVGFRHHSAFSFAFKEATGETPWEYRQCRKGAFPEGENQGQSNLFR